MSNLDHNSFNKDNMISNEVKECSLKPSSPKLASQPLLEHPVEANTQSPVVIRCVHMDLSIEPQSINDYCDTCKLEAVPQTNDFKQSMGRNAKRRAQRPMRRLKAIYVQ